MAQVRRMRYNCGKRIPGENVLANEAWYFGREADKLAIIRVFNMGGMGIEFLST